MAHAPECRPTTVLVLIILALALTEMGCTEKVYVTSNDACYHAADCPRLAGDEKAYSKENVIAKGYTPCARCWFGVVPAQRPAEEKELLAKRTPPTSVTSAQSAAPKIRAPSATQLIERRRMLPGLFANIDHANTDLAYAEMLDRFDAGYHEDLVDIGNTILASQEVMANHNIAISLYEIMKRIEKVNPRPLETSLSFGDAAALALATIEAQYAQSAP